MVLPIGDKFHVYISAYATKNVNRSAGLAILPISQELRATTTEVKPTTTVTGIPK